MYEPSGFKNNKPFWTGTVTIPAEMYGNNEPQNAYIWFENNHWTWNTQFSGNEKMRCQGRKEGGEYPWEVSPFVHAPEPKGWKNEGINVIVETEAPQGVNLTDESLIASWHVSSSALPNTAEVNGKPVGFIEYTGNLSLEPTHIKNIKVSAPTQQDTWIRGFEVQQNKQPSEDVSPYYFIDSKISSNHLPEFTMSFFYNVQDYNEVDVLDMFNPIPNAQGVFCFNYRPSEFVRMFTLKNKQFSPNAPTKYFDNIMPITGTSLFVDGGPFQEPQMLVPDLKRNKTYNVVIRYAEPDAEFNSEPEPKRYIRTEKTYDFGTNPMNVEASIENEHTDTTETGKIMTLEYLMENIDLIDEYGADFFDDVFIKIESPLKLSGSKSTYNSYATGRRTWYLQKGTNGARWSYDNRHPFKRFNLYIKSWPGSRRCIVIKQQIKTRDLTKGQFDVTLIDTNSTSKTKIVKSVQNHNFVFNWDKISKISFGGGANSAFGGFRMYNRILSDAEVENISKLDNPRFNQLGNSYP